MTKLAIHPLTAARWADLEAVFRSRGCAEARSCWCMFYRVSGKGQLTRPGEARGERARQSLQALTAQDPPPGLLGYRGDEPVGWVSLGPRADYAKLARSPVMKPVDDQPVWSIVCFVVPAAHRGQGVAEALLAGAVAYARQRGVTLLEAYPVDRSQPDAKGGSWFGAQSMFDRAGFAEVARRRADRPVVRLKLTR